MTRIKICCIQNETEIASAQEAGASAVGLRPDGPLDPSLLAAFAKNVRNADNA